MGHLVAGLDPRGAIESDHERYHMMRGHSILRVVSWFLLAVSAGLLWGSPASAQSNQELFNKLTEALRRAAEPSPNTPMTPTPPPSPNAPPRPVAAAPPHGLTLLGVVIGGERRLALIQSAGGQEEMVPVGQSLAGYRLVDVEETQVTLESQLGERIVLRMPTDGQTAGPAVRR
jgi:hypothetical protein